MQIGAELYGHDGIAADREIMQLLLVRARRRPACAACISISATSGCIARSRDAAGLDGTGEGNDAELFAALRDKDAPAVHDLTDAAARARARRAARAGVPVRSRRCDARGGARVLPRAARSRKARWTRSQRLLRSVSDVDAIHVDLADLRGYHYYTGATFSVFAQDDNGAVVDCGRGGRYDGVGRAFGRARPATGFSMDLRRLASRLPARTRSLARSSRRRTTTRRSRKAIDELRAKGEAVVVALPGEAHERRPRRLDASPARPGASRRRRWGRT